MIASQGTESVTVSLVVVVTTEELTDVGASVKSPLFADVLARDLGWKEVRVMMNTPARGFKCDLCVSIISV